MFNDFLFSRKSQRIRCCYSLHTSTFRTAQSDTKTTELHAWGFKVDETGTTKILNFNFIILGFIFLGIFIVGSLNALRSYTDVLPIFQTSSPKYHVAV